MKRWRIGIVGAGAIVRDRHYPGLKDRDDVELVAVCNSTPESTARAAEEFQIPEVCASWQEMVARSDLDVIWIGTAPHLHQEITIAALESGKHVFCQARMAMNLAEARAMRDCSRQHPELVTMLCPPPMGMQKGATFKRMLDEGLIGDPVHLNFTANDLVWQDADASMHWRQDVSKSGQNALTLGIFAEVLGYWLGYPEPSRVIARKKVHRSLQKRELVLVPDVIHVMAEWKSGWQGILQWSGVAAGAPAPRLECYGSRGTLIYDFGLNGEEEILYATIGSVLQKVKVPVSEQGSWDVEDRFIRALSQASRPEPTFETGVCYMEFIDAVYRNS
ncbi:MAG: Gfo/Idh/MocA family oxidoreductase [Verrucomicrobiota bacterium]